MPRSLSTTSNSDNSEERRSFTFDEEKEKGIVSISNDFWRKLYSLSYFVLQALAIQGIKEKVQLYKLKYPDARKVQEALLLIARRYGDSLGLSYKRNKVVRDKEAIVLVTSKQVSTTNVCHVLGNNKHPHLFAMPKNPKEYMPIKIEAVMNGEKEEAMNVLPTNVEVVASPIKWSKATIEYWEVDEDKVVANRVVSILEKDIVEVYVVQVSTT